jgi:Dehydrogenases with different specificities (related to short-chain alcohol dehydrogenases)
MPGRLDGKVAIVTGAGSGQGAAITTLFIEEGAKVVLADINESGMEEVTSDLAPDSYRIVYCDVSQVDQVKNAVATATGEFGRLDILCNVAGIGGEGGALTEFPDDRVVRQFEVNYLGVFLFMKHAVPVMIENGGGAIVNVGSVGGYPGFSAGGGQNTYGAMKAAMHHMSQVTAGSYGKQGIRVNVIAPGTIDTPMMRGRMDITKDKEISSEVLFESPSALGRIGTPREIATAALFLASDEASYVSGVVLPVDGGWLCNQGLVGVERNQ